MQILGIDDRDDAHQVEQELVKIEVDRRAFSILLYHRPHGLEAAEASGIDLMISGHTHNGQIFPFNLVVNRVFDRVAGMYQLGKVKIVCVPGYGYLGARNAGWN